MPVEKKNRFLLLFGSQTGQAKAIAEEIAEKAETLHGLKANIHCLSQTEKKFNIEREKCVVIVTSTTGDGDPPDTASKFVRRLRKKTLPDDYLANVNYALLSLGDSNYTNFCNCGKSVDRRLEELGAKRFYPSGFADDAVGLEVVVEPWMDGLFPVLRTFLGLPQIVESDKNNLTEIKVSPIPDQSCLTQTNGNISQKNEILPNGKGDNSEGNVSKGDNSTKVLEATANGDGTQKQENSNSNNILTLTNGVHIHSSETNGTSQHKDVHEITEMKNSNDNCKNTQQEMEASLRTSVPLLSESSLTLPALPQSYLHLEFLHNETLDTNSLTHQNGTAFPSAASPVTMATVVSSSVLTREDALKKTLSLKLDISDSDIKYLPGDSISVICKNCEDEVNTLLNRLGVSDKTDDTCSFSIIPGTKKRNPSVPPHIPQICTIRHIFLTCVDIREAPKKALLRCMVEHTSDQLEKRRLQELCSKQGSNDYSKFIREAGVSLLDILNTFPSCSIPVERILEHLPRLQPRPYSVCSSPLDEAGIIEISFNVINVSEESGRTYNRAGVCTGMLDQLTSGIQKFIAASTDSDSLTSELAQVTLDKNTIKVPIFARTSQNFHMPEDLSVPVIMIGPGTGVAPFIGFLRHRDCLKQKMSDANKYGDTWLFFGCRHKERDYIYRREMESFESSGTLTKLCVSFSRDAQPSDAPKYVQQNLTRFGTELVTLIDHGAMVFVCGDAKNMAKDVNEAFLQILQNVKGISVEEAKSHLMKMRLYKRYLEDVWT